MLLQINKIYLLTQKLKIHIPKILLLIAFAADLFFVYQNQNAPRFFTKTLLVPLLILIFLLETKPLNHSKTQPLNHLFLTGLMFSFFGDLFLLFNWGFLPGLGSFLLAHFFYIFCFTKLTVKKHLPILAAGLLVYVTVLIFCLFPYLKEMKIPVIIYGVVIAVMLYFAVRTTNKNLILGAVLFVISDTVLAINLFVKETTVLSMIVMITYISAQWFLVKGLLSNSKKMKFPETIH